jgi:hypothetical protein
MGDLLQMLPLTWSGPGKPGWVWSKKGRFCREINRVPSPGGRLVFHDIFQGKAGVTYYPAPWAQTAELSALAAPEDIRAVIAAADWILLAGSTRAGYRSNGSGQHCCACRKPGRQRSGCTC